VTCSTCGLALPAEARFCARCGLRLAAGAAGPPGPGQDAPAAPGQAPVWLIVLFWVGAAGTFWVAVLYGIIAGGAVPSRSLGSGADPASLRAAAALIAVCSASLCVAHVSAALGLMSGRQWARTFATMVCVVWMLTCVGVPVGLLAIGALWRTRRGAPG
jgi:hypothetical protein